MFLLDTNVFITAKNKYYGPDFAPGFWEWIADEYQGRGISTISAVRAELLAQDDELSDWARTMPEGFWLEEDERDGNSLRAVSRWAMSENQRFFPYARAEFLAKADYRLVAMALSRDHVVVTHEVPAPDSKKSIKIPDACRHFGVECRDPFEVFRELGLLLVRPSREV